MKFVKKLFILSFLSVLFPVFLSAQTEIVVKKSEIIENIDGKNYYMHFIKQGETLFEIAKVYDLPIEDIYTHNPGAKTGIKKGQILKIPYSGSKKSNQVNETDYFIHIVESKETLYGITKKYGADITEIMNINPGMSESVKEGQSIKIPEKYKPHRSETNQTVGKELKHTVKTGETLYAISRLYNVSMNEIKMVNPGLTESLKTGQEIIIPGISNVQEVPPVKNETPVEQETVKTHKVLAGETLYSISKKYSVDTDEVKKLNPTMKETLTVGQILVIPVKSHTKNYIFYSAEKNDKLEDIALKFGVSYSELLALNPEIQKKVNKGQQIKIPIKIKETENTQPEIPEITGNEEINSSCDNIKKNMQETYNVALMIPLFLDQIDSLDYATDIDEMDDSKLNSLKFIQFYEGFIMAVDSINKAGMNLNLTIYDVDNSPEKVNAVLNASALKSMDLIIGPFYSESFKKLADFAKAHKIKIVNPLSTREEIIFGNPYVFKLKPDLDYQSQQIAEFIISQYPESNVIILRQNKYKFQEEMSYIKNYINSHRKSSINISNRQILDIMHTRKTDNLFSDNNMFTIEKLSRKLNDSTYVNNTVKEIILSTDSTYSLKLSLSKLRKNIIIALIDEKVFSQELMSWLNKLSDDFGITLFGLPEWDKFSDLETHYLLNLNVHYSTPSLVNYNDLRIKKWILNFRKNYYTEPMTDKYAFEGFDVGWYFLNALFRYGSEFEKCLEQIDMRLIQTKYNFEHLKGNGYQNTHWNIGRNYDYQYIPASD